MSTPRENHIAEQSEGSQIRVPMKLSLRAGIGVLLVINYLRAGFGVLLAPQHPKTKGLPSFIFRYCNAIFLTSYIKTLRSKPATK